MILLRIVYVNLHTTVKFNYGQGYISYQQESESGNEGL
jgi:hypothetical protein